MAPVASRSRSSTTNHKSRLSGVKLNNGFSTALALMPVSHIPLSAYFKYHSVWPEVNQAVHGLIYQTAEEKSLGDPECRIKIANELNRKYEKVCDGAYLSLQLQPFYYFMTDPLKTIFYETHIWEQMFGSRRGFMGDDSALEEFKFWFFSTFPMEDEDISDSEGGVGTDGLRGVDGESEDRYADGEMEDTDGGAKLRWY